MDKDHPKIDIPPEIQEEVRTVVREAFELASEQVAQLKSDIAEFNQRSHEAKEKIKNGARRTNGRIV